MDLQTELEYRGRRQTRPPSLARRPVDRRSPPVIAMGVSGAVVWCRGGDGWVPCRLDAIKLPAMQLTSAHWQSVVNLIQLANTQQLYLQDVRVPPPPAPPPLLTTPSSPPPPPPATHPEAEPLPWDGVEKQFTPRCHETRLQRLRQAWARNTRKLSTGSNSYCVLAAQL